jgi:hypothetical protein
MALRDGCLERAGVILHKAEKIVGLAEQEIILADGERRSFGLAINACFNMPPVRLQGASGLVWPLALNDDLALEAHGHIWIAGPKKESEVQPYISAADWEALGEAAGYNAWAATQGFKTLPHRQRDRLLKPFGIGFQSFCDAKAFTFSGRTAWLLSRLGNLLATPGLEKNLRILID